MQDKSWGGGLGHQQTLRNMALGGHVGLRKAAHLSPNLLFSRAHSQTCQVGLNFASEEESKRFRGHVLELLDRRQRKSGTC